MLYAAVNGHAERSQITVMDEAGVVIKRTHVPTSVARWPRSSDRRIKPTLYAIVAAGLAACAQEPEPLQEAILQAQRVVAYDTVQVSKTVYDTARIVVHDTVHVMHVVPDTVRVERLVTIYDTVQIVVAHASGKREFGPLASPDRLQEYVADIELGIISGRALAAINRGIPAFMTVGAGALDSLQLALIATVFDALPSEIVRFRWAPSVAPAGSIDAGSVTCAIWRTTDSDVRPEVIKIAASGKIEGRVASDEHASGGRPIHPH